MKTDIFFFIGDMLMNNTKADMWEFKRLIIDLRKTMALRIRGLDVFKQILSAITTVLKTNVNAEQKYMTYQQTYDIARQHSIEFDPADEAMAYTVEKEWKDLYVSAMYRNMTMESTKNHFATMTEAEIDTFVDIINNFVKQFDSEGPGTVGENLDLGLKLMDEYYVSVNFKFSISNFQFFCFLLFQ